MVSKVFINAPPVFDGTERNPRAKAAPVSVCPKNLDPTAAPFKAASNPRLRRASSAPTANLFANLRPASLRPVSPVSSSVCSMLGIISKLSDAVARPSVATAVLYPSVPTAVEPARPFQVLRVFLPTFEEPYSIADLVNLPRPAVDIALPAFAAFAAWLALPSQPAIGIKPTPNATRSSVISPAAPISGFMDSNASVTALEVLVPSAASIPKAPSSVIP